METPSNSSPTPQSDEDKNKKKKIYIIGGIVLVTVVIGGYFLSSGSGLQGRLTRNLAEPAEMDRLPDLNITSHTTVEKTSESNENGREQEREDTPMNTESTAVPEPAPEPAPEPEPEPETMNTESAAVPEPEPESEPETMNTETAKIPELEPEPPIFQQNTLTYNTLVSAKVGYTLMYEWDKLRYAQNNDKVSYRLSITLPEYEAANNEYNYTTTLSAKVCKNSECAYSHTENIDVYQDKYASVFKTHIFNVTRNELYNAIQEIGAEHGDTLKFTVEIMDPTGQPLESLASNMQVVEDDTLRIPFNLEAFKITDIKYNQKNNNQEDIVRIFYTQTSGKTNQAGIKYFYTGDEEYFKTYITLCEAPNPEADEGTEVECYDIKEYDSTGIASIGGAYELKNTEISAFMEEHGFEALGQLSLSVSDSIEGAERYYAGK